MKLTKEEYITIRDLSFKTVGYHKNFDLIVMGENIINEYDGKISKLRILERKPPLVIGDYAISSWNLKLGREMKINLHDVLKTHSNEPTYNEFFDLVNKNQVSFEEYDRIVFIQSLMLKKEYRKKQITEEFVEFVYKEFYDEKTLIVAFVLPVQYNKLIMDYFIENSYMKVREVSGELESQKISANKYYQINELAREKTDQEFNKIKLFSVAQKCGFERIAESFIFKYNPTKTIERLKLKWGITEKA